MIEHGAAGAPDFIVHPEDDLEPFYGLVIEPGDEPVAELSEGRLKYKSRETIEVFNSRFGPSIAEFLTKDGHPPDMIYLFLYLLYIQDEQLNAVDELVCQAEAVLR